MSTGQPNDYAIGMDHAFFKLQDPKSGAISYTRNGHFHIGEFPDGKFYLLTESGKHVLDEKGEKMLADESGLRMLADAAKQGQDRENNLYENENDEESIEEKRQKVGVYTLTYPSRLVNKGDNEFAVRAGDTQNVDKAVENPVLEEGTLERSGTDMAKEMTRLIESQRAFSYALKMVQTSDEVEGTINQLRG